MRTCLRVTLSCGLLALALVACGGAPAPVTTGQPTTSVATTGAPATNIPSSELPPSEPAPTDAPGSFVPGPVSFRVVNLIADGTSVDVYARTQGLVQAFPVHPGLGYGEVTEYFAPPDPGSVVVTTAGAGDPTCVATCPHIISSSSTGFGEGDTRTIVLYDEGTQELWHDPDAASVDTTANALRPADPSVALIVTVAVGLNVDFGVRLAFDGEAGCQVNRVSENVLIGGNQVGEFAFDGGSVSVNLHENSDQECTGDAVGGPFEISAATGERVMLVLYGESGGIEALVLDI